MRAPRVIAIGLFRRQGRILVGMRREPGTGRHFARPLGGGVEFGERAADALAREIHEETGQRIRDVRYLGLIENLFTFDGQERHEIVLVHDARFEDPEIERGGSLRAELVHGTVEARWASPQELHEQGIALFPRGLERLLDA